MARILIVEDDRELARAISRWLGTEGHTIDQAANGEDAMYLLDTVTFDCIILDRNLPDVEGLELLKRYRLKGLSCPVLFLTGKDSLEEKLEGLTGGADDYLTKPFHGRELVARLRILLRRAPVIESSRLIAGDFELVPERKSVKRGDEEIRLVEREYVLMEFFMRHPNEFFTSAKLLNQLWPGDLEAGNHALTSCLKRLRKKLDIEGRASCIHNAHGIGYGLLVATKSSSDNK